MADNIVRGKSISNCSNRAHKLVSALFTWRSWRILYEVDDCLVQFNLVDAFRVNVGILNITVISLKSKIILM